jgi:hypothetical protein
VCVCLCSSTGTFVCKGLGSEEAVLHGLCRLVEKPDNYALMDLPAALEVARMCKSVPGKAKANEYLKRCRADMQVVGERVDVEAEMPEFHWRAYLAHHPKATNIFKSPVESFWAEAFPEDDPNASKLVNMAPQQAIRCDVQRAFTTFFLFN